MGRLLWLSVALGLLVAPQWAEAYVRSTTNSKLHKLEWRKLPIRFAYRAEGYSKIDPDLKGTEFKAIEESFATWRKVSCSRVTFQSMGVQTKTAVPFGFKERSASSNVSVVVFRDQVGSWHHDANALAITTVVWNEDTGEIWDADIEFNAVEFNLSTDPRGARPREYDIQNTLTHEIGHLLGMEHSADREATMFASATEQERSKRDLATDDVNGLCAIYPNSGKAPRFTVLETDADMGCSTVGRAPQRGGGVAGLAVVLLLGLVVRLARRREG